MSDLKETSNPLAYPRSITSLRQFSAESHQVGIVSILLRLLWRHCFNCELQAAGVQQRQGVRLATVESLAPRHLVLLPLSHSISPSVMLPPGAV